MPSRPERRPAARAHRGRPEPAGCHLRSPRRSLGMGLRSRDGPGGASSRRGSVGEAARDFTAVPVFDGDSLDADVAWELAALRSAGISEVIAVDLTHEDFGIPVVRVIVPGLEGPTTTVPNCRLGQRAAKLTATDERDLRFPRAHARREGRAGRTRRRLPSAGRRRGCLPAVAAASACHRDRRRLLRPRPRGVAQGNHVDDGTRGPRVRWRRPGGAARGRARQLRDARRRLGLPGLQAGDPGPRRRGSGAARGRRRRVPALVRGDGEHPPDPGGRRGTREVISAATASILLAAGTALFYPDRTWPELLRAAGATRADRAELDALRQWLPAGPDRPAGRRRRGHAARDARIPRRRPGTAAGELEHGAHGDVGGGEAPRGHPGL